MSKTYENRLKLELPRAPIRNRSTNNYKISFYSHQYSQLIDKKEKRRKKKKGGESSSANEKEKKKETGKRELFELSFLSILIGFDWISLLACVFVCKIKNSLSFLYHKKHL
jgi:hypothetical protein